MICRLQVGNNSLDFLDGIVFLNKVELSQVRFNHINHLLANAWIKETALEKDLLSRSFSNLAQLIAMYGKLLSFSNVISNCPTLQKM